MTEKSNLIPLSVNGRETTFEMTKRTLSSLKANGLTPSEKLLLEVLKKSILSDRSPEMSDVVIIWKDETGARKSISLSKVERRAE